MRIGFIGLGIMGAPMARNLLRAGHALVVYGRTRARVDALLAAGATAAPSPAALAAEVDAVVTSLPDTPDVEAVYTGEQGVLAGARPGLLAIDTSTIAPRRLSGSRPKRPRAGWRFSMRPSRAGSRGRSPARSPAWWAARPRRSSARARSSPPSAGRRPTWAAPGRARRRSS